MCRRDELIETIGIAADKRCAPGNVETLLRNVTRQIAESGSELTAEDKTALEAAKQAAKQSAVANYEQRLARI